MVQLLLLIIWGIHMKRTHEVFGISPSVLSDSYVDRGALDQQISRKLSRSLHIALRGESKCGKSWLRQKAIPNAIVVQCRLKTTVLDIYTDILAQLDIKLVIERTEKDSIKGSVEGTADFGWNLIAKIKAKVSGEVSDEETIKFKGVGQDINDLRFVADLINVSKRRVVVEDFHYLTSDERKIFSFDLKALWDYSCFFVIIGVWTKTNLLIHLNQDLMARIDEIEITWSPSNLAEVITKGSAALNIRVEPQLKSKILSDCYGNVGILQQLLLNTLDEHSVFEESTSLADINNENHYLTGALTFAEQLNPRFQKFAKDVSSGIRKRTEATGIYAHAMAVIIESDDHALINGLELSVIFEKASKRQPRILKGNLRTVLQKIEELQVDEEGRGLVVSFNDATEEVTAIDRTLLFYRKYITVPWPWDELIAEANRIHQVENKIII